MLSKATGKLSAPNQVSGSDQPPSVSQIATNGKKNNNNSGNSGNSATKLVQRPKYVIPEILLVPPTDSQTKLLDVPDYVLAELFSFLEVYEIMTLRTVCRFFDNICTNPRFDALLWKESFLHEVSLTKKRYRYPSAVGKNQTWRELYFFWFVKPKLEKKKENKKVVGNINHSTDTGLRLDEHGRVVFKEQLKTQQPKANISKYRVLDPQPRTNARKRD